MTKYLVAVIVALTLAIINPTTSDAKVMYDGAEVVQGQTGKMTFTKDIKVYKKNPSGTFDSLVVKRNNFFRTYDIEKYDGKIFYQMGQYRVQATNLVVFKEVPIQIRASFYSEPIYLVINRNRVKDYGKYFSKWNGDISFLDTDNGQVLSYCISDGDEGEWCDDKYHGTDIKIAEKIKREEGVRYELTVDIQGQLSPLEGAIREIMYVKGSIFSSKGIEINGHLYVDNGLLGNDSRGIWIPLKLLKPVGDK